MNSQNNIETSEAVKAKKKIKTPVKVLLWIVGILLFIIIFLVTAFFILSNSGKNKLLTYSDVKVSLPNKIADSIETDGKTIYYKGEKYVLNENITNILAMGIDKRDFSELDNKLGYGTNGQADSIFLVAFDTVTGKTSVISVSRETMLDMDTYSVGGEFTGIKKQQLCLAYSYGNNQETSCENVVKSVSRYFYGLPVNSYFSFDFEAVKIVNDAVEGVTLVPTQDIQISPKSYAKAGEEITLSGEEALRYIRVRTEDIDANAKRMKRQTQYIKELSKVVISKTKSDILTPVKLFNLTGNNAVSDLDASKITYLSECFVKNNLSGDINFMSIEGTSSMGEKYVEFKEDENKFFELILSVFYNKV